MSIRVAIQHQMHYAYDRFIEVSPQVIRLKPAVHSRTPIHSYSLKISPENHFINWQQDPFGNFQARVVFPEKINKLEIDVEVIADLKVINPFDFFVDEYAEKYPFDYEPQLKKELAPYLKATEEGELLKQFLNTKVPKKEMQIVDFLVEINRALYEQIDYTIRLEPGVQTCEETLGKALGSCRDSAWVLVQTFRHLGLAARFVSGYLVQLTADEKSLDGPSGPEEDFTDLHAWAEVFVPGAGWVGLDATSGLFAGEGHIPLSCTPEPGSAAPLTGTTEPVEAKFNYKNEVIRIHEEPRVTKPYTEEEWSNILKVGNKVDWDLEKMDVRLTMGGEPTFVSIDDMESPEWNTDADGPHKRKLAQELTARLRDTFCPNGMLHFGQGKLYPGEVLPRWQYGIFWRKDGHPIWKNNKLLDSPAKKGKFKKDDAKTFFKQLTTFLNIPAQAVIPAYEDAFYFAWEENKLPTDKDPLKTGLKDSIERRTLTEVLDRGLDEPTGFVLPIRFNREKEAWESCKWPFRRKHLFLIPGNSTIGYRLPLNSLPENIMEDQDFPRDPFDEHPDLEDFEAKLSKKKGKTTNNIREDICFRTAMCIHIVEGRIHIFLPPQDLLEHYLELVAAIHLTANELNTPVILEGYEPPSEGKLNKLFVTPDPGVIEVNVHPSKSWKELCDTTLSLYEQAKLSRLGTEKFMIDGRHTGTGGGNHITIGGFKAEDSPLLRKPKLLQSIITYWQHHPSLSYLFSGPFIGPTSQAPRVDEARDDVLYELEIAFGQVPSDENPPFWLADRLFRNLLIDVTGNTHRAELCIDKLYSPYGSAGRQGILEFRGFDMPPHAQMSLTQNLLIRALIARFWKTPYEKRLVHWGTELHDRFMLEHYVRNDMNEIITELQDCGYNFERSWFDAFIEFRFPVLGKAQFDDINLELRWAIEPWHVLGEEITSQGTARYVDSSVERVQVKVNGWNSERYILACNETRIPLRATGIKGQYVAGVRYKAWAPPSALHPTIGVDTPLVFDIIDTWNNKSIGGFTYHVAHPGGRSYDNLPVNSNAAESRRHTRFFSEGHTQGNVKTVQEFTAVGRFFEEKRDTKKIDIPIEERSVDFPNTLDLRKKRR